MQLKLQRFQGKDPARISQCGCQGYVDDEGTKHECPFQESLEKMKETFDSTNRLGGDTGFDNKCGFLAMCTLDHDDVLTKTCEFNWFVNDMHVSSDRENVCIAEMGKATMRCHACHRFKGMLCGDDTANVHISRNATVFITGEDDMEDQGIIITNDDDFSDLFQ